MLSFKGTYNFHQAFFVDGVVVEMHWNIWSLVVLNYTYCMQFMHGTS